MPLISLWPLSGFFTLQYNTKAVAEVWDFLMPKISQKQNQFFASLAFMCNGAEWSKDRTQAAESIKWRPQQAYGSNQVLLAQPQFSAHPKSSLARIDKRTARATGNTRYRYSKIAPLDHKMADDCVSLARTNTVTSRITKPVKTWKTLNESYSYNLLNRINKLYTHDELMLNVLRCHLTY